MFRFKQFSICQDRCPMKVGTDGVLLGAWAAVHDSDRMVLDIGTGTGLIALMVAQRAPQARVMGVDIDSVAQAQARANADASPWGARLEFLACRVQDFIPSEGFDLILSNPPFFVDSLTCPDQGRTMARHAVSLPYEELRDAVVRLLNPDGRFAIILPTAEADHFIAVCADHLRLTRRTHVRTTPSRAPKRVLMEFVAVAALPVLPALPALPALPDRHAPATLPTTLPTALPASAAPDSTKATALPAPLCSELTIGTGEQECFSPEYRALTRDFYLKF